MDIAKCQNRNKIKYGKFIEEYLFSREHIALIILIVDIRHKLGENDLLMYEYIKSTKKPYLIIANKADKIAVTKVDDAIIEMRKQLNLKEEGIILPFSAERKIYSEKVWDNISNWS